MCTECNRYQAENKAIYMTKQWETVGEVFGSLVPDCSQTRPRYKVYQQRSVWQNKVKLTAVIF